MSRSEIPQPIADAIITMLRPYAPEVTYDSLQEAILSKPEKQETPEKLLTRKEASTMLHISIPTIDRMLRDKELAYRKIRRAVRIPLSAVEQLMKGNDEC